MLCDRLRSSRIGLEFRCAICLIYAASTTAGEAALTGAAPDGRAPHDGRAQLTIEAFSRSRPHLAAGFTAQVHIDELPIATMSSHLLIGYPFAIS